MSAAGVDRKRWRRVAARRIDVGRGSCEMSLMDLGRLALSLPIPPDVGTCLDWTGRAEALGFGSIWIAETGGPGPFVLAGAVAGRTKRARIGLAVSPVYFLTPATIAAATGTVAQLAPGRFILGLGTSSHAMVENWHGLP